MPASKNLANNERVKNMNVQKELAAHLGQQAASKTELQKTPYANSAPMSSVKFRQNLAELLLYLQRPLSKKMQRIGWQLFEVLLRHYLTDKGAS